MSDQMIIYGCVAQGTKIIAEASPQSIDQQSNDLLKLSQECEEVLQRLQSVRNQPFLLFTSQNLQFLCHMDGQMTYLIILKNIVSKSSAQQFLMDLKQQFGLQFNIQQQLAPTNKFKQQFNQLFSEFNQQLTTQPNQLQEIRNDLSQTKDKLAECVDILLKRGEKLQQLYTEVDELKGMTVQFKRGSGDLQKSFLQRNKKYIIISAILLVVVIVIIVVLATAL